MALANTAAVAAPSSAAPAPVRTMVVDDSAVIRGLLTRWLEEDPAIRVVASAANGLAALRTVQTEDVEVVILDIEMPEMDGMTALPKLLELRRDLQVIMASTLTLRNADISLQALSLGAADYIAKPQSARMVSAGIDFRQDLVQKVKALAAKVRKAKGIPAPDLLTAEPAGAAPAVPPPAPQPAPVAAPAQRPTPFAAARPVAASKAAPAAPASAPVRPADIVRPKAEAPLPKPVQPGSKTITLLPASKQKPQILAIGSSTGGPQALFTLLGALPQSLGLPIVITQHMPPTFTAILAQHLTRLTGFPASEATDGEVMKPGRAYVAPGDQHMVLADRMTLRLNQDPPENFCRPAVDPLFRSVAAHYGGSALCVVLTGMGADGMRGGRDITAAGGTILAQDEASSVVWGMPGAVATAGLAHQVLPLNELAPAILTLLRGARP
jgi:two-component system chemotaxis response regulator CheB